MSLTQMFLIGVVGPTVVTILIFITFLVCWFKFNWKEKFFEKFMKPQKANGGRIGEHKMEPNMLYRNHVEDYGDGVNPEQHHHGHIRIHATPPSDNAEEQSNMYEPVEIDGQRNPNIAHYLPVWTNIADDDVSNNDNSSGYMSPVSRSSSDLNDLSMDTSGPNLDISNHSQCMNVHVDISKHINMLPSDCIYNIDCTSCSQDSSGLDNSTCTESSVSASEGVQYGHIVTVNSNLETVRESTNKSKCHTLCVSPDRIKVRDSQVILKGFTDKDPVKDSTITSKRITQKQAHDTKYICTDYSDFTKVQLVPNSHTVMGFDV